MSKYNVPNPATKAKIPVRTLQNIDPAKTPVKAYIKKDRVTK